jgi:signal transduction histidine kinase
VQDLALHVLDIVENAIAASATRVSIEITEDTERDLLSIEIGDNGKGMDAETRERALDPFFTSRTTRRVGLGLPLLAQAARESDGRIEITSAPGRGTTVRTSFRHSHPDRKPLGDMAETVRTIVAGRPELELRFEYRIDDEVHRFDTAEARRNGTG